MGKKSLEKKSELTLALGLVAANCWKWWKRSSQLMYARLALGALRRIRLINEWRPSTDLSAILTLVRLLALIPDHYHNRASEAASQHIIENPLSSNEIEITT